MSMQFEIQFKGDVAVAKKSLLNYFDESPSDGVFVDSDRREWIVSSNDDETGLFKLVTPMLYMTEQSDKMLLHDVILMLKITKQISIDDDCGMCINIPAPSDARKLGLYYERYVACQYDQIREFNSYVSTSHRGVKLYIYDVYGYEIDTVSDIIVSLIANYGSLTATGIEVASKFALDFSRVVTHNELQFKAFNSSLDDAYILRAAEWVNNFIKECNDAWLNGWKDEYLRLRTLPEYVSIPTTI